MNNNKFERYSRQFLFPEVGIKGQQKLINSRAAIVGMGALGTVIANHLTRSGVGFIRIIDRDFVEMSNLQRQMLYDEDDALTNKPKAIAAYHKLTKYNSTITIEPIVTDIHSWNAEELLSDVDIIIDGTDNLVTRYIINDVSTKYKIPWIHGGAVRSRGMFAVFDSDVGPCYRCLFPTPVVGQLETCDLVGVISPITHLVGSLQATEAIKLLVGDENNRNSKLVQFDIWLNDEMEMDLSLSKNPNCPACSLHQYDYLKNEQHGEDYTALCGRNAIQISPKTERDINMTDMKEKLMKVGPVEINPYLLKCKIDCTVTLVIFKNGRVVIQGTDDITKAKSLYAKYIGT